MDDFVKGSSHTGKQRPLLCILPPSCSWKQIPHLSPRTPAITVISPICLCQWQASWSCSLYSFSHKSLLIVSLEGWCGPCGAQFWALDSLLTWGRLLTAPVCASAFRLGSGNEILPSECCDCQSRHGKVCVTMILFRFVRTVTQSVPPKTGDCSCF